MPAHYAPLFDPQAADQRANHSYGGRRGDELPPSGYVYDAGGRIALAVNVALAAGRPLLVRGKPGTGKSSLAPDVADRLGWRYYGRTITSRTHAKDLLWSYDTVRRLNDAAAGGTIEDPLAYLNPGVLWWAFSTESASRRGLSEEDMHARGLSQLSDPSGNPGRRAIVLLDEIDKADPDLPNDLLTPLGALEFEVTEVEEHPIVKADEPPLVVVTTNEERDLPRAFVRRCVVLALPEPDADRMLEIAHAHFGHRVDDEQLRRVLQSYRAVISDREPNEHEPGLAEFLDAVASVIELGATPHDVERWTQVVELTLKKPAGETLP